MTNEPAVIHVTSSYPPNLGGLEKVVQNLASTQSKAGLNVSVITSAQGQTVNMAPDDFEVTRLKGYWIANTIVMPNLFWKLIRIRRDNMVHLHVVQAYTPEMVWIASRLKRFPYIAQIHLDTYPSGPAGFLLKFHKSLVLKRVLRAASFVTVFTEDQKLDVHRKYGVDLEKIKIIANGVDDEFYYNKPRNLHKKSRLLFVGRLNAQKNLKQLLHALDGVSHRFETTLVGSGELEHELKELALDLRLKNIDFAGRADGEKCLDYYRRADIFVLPSEREGMPLVLLEAMAMSLPIVATDVTGSRDVVRAGENGLLVPYDDANSFRTALLKITSSENLYKRLSQASWKMSEHYSWTKVARKFEKLYEESNA